MQNSFWKLTALVGILASAVLVVIQGQQILNQNQSNSRIESEPPSDPDQDIELGAEDDLESAPKSSKRIAKGFDFRDPPNELRSARSKSSRTKKNSEVETASYDEVEEDALEEPALGEGLEEVEAEEKPKNKKGLTRQPNPFDEEEAPREAPPEDLATTKRHTNPPRRTVEAPDVGSDGPQKIGPNRSRSAVDESTDEESTHEESSIEMGTEGLTTLDEDESGSVEIPDPSLSSDEMDDEESTLDSDEAETEENPAAKEETAPRARSETSGSSIDLEEEEEEDDDGDVVVEESTTSTRAPSPRTNPRTTGTRTNPRSSSRGPQIEPPLDEEIVPRTERRPTAKDLEGDGLPGNPEQRKAQKPQLSIEKISPPNAVLGQPMIYKILVKNNGSTPARQVVVEDQIPQGTTLSGTIPQAELTGKKLYWKLGTLKAGEERKISVRVIPNTEGEIGSIAKVNFVAEVAASTQITAPKMELVLEGPAKSQVGEEVQAHFRITNSGKATAKNVRLRAVLSAELEHPESGDLENSIGDLEPGKSYEIDLPCLAKIKGKGKIEATVSGEGFADESYTYQVQIEGSSLSVKTSAPAKAFLNRATVVRLELANEGSKPVTQARVLTSLPKGMEFVKASHEGAPDRSGRVIVWTIDEIAGNEGVELELTVKPRTRGDLKLASQVTSSSGKFESETPITIHGVPQIAVEGMEMDAPVAVGEEFAYRVRIINRGSEFVRDISLDINLPDELSCSSIKGPGSPEIDGKKVTIPQIDSLAPGRELSWTLQMSGEQAGQGRVKYSLGAEHLNQPLSREEELVIVDLAE